MIHLIVLIEQNSSKITKEMEYIPSEQNKYGCPGNLDTTGATIYVSWLENIINSVLL